MKFKRSGVGDTAAGHGEQDGEVFDLLGGNGEDVLVQDHQVGLRVGQGGGAGGVQGHGEGLLGQEGSGALGRGGAVHCAVVWKFRLSPKAAPGARSPRRKGIRRGTGDAAKGAQPGKVR